MIWPSKVDQIRKTIITTEHQEIVLQFDWLIFVQINKAMALLSQDHCYSCQGFSLQKQMLELEKMTEETLRTA